MARKYRCMFCDITAERPKLIQHIDKKHQDMIPEGYDGARLVFDMINKTTGGKCRVCGKDTPWNPKIQRYDTLCDNPKCKEYMREQYKKNMLRVRGTYNILNDPEQQKLMLSHRKISGKYQHSDGGIITYTGEYERKALEFMDLLMEIPSKEIYSPGPTMEYMYNGKKHIYIPDFYLPLYNLIIEIKDGGDNKNKQESDSRIASREKTIEKEKLITDKGQYNYIRLTNNDFPQLIEVFMIMKKKLIDGDDSKTIKINEDNMITDLIGYVKNKVSTVNPFNKTKVLINAMQKFHYDYNPNLYDSSIAPYKTMTPEQFKSYGAGLCWDYTAFEAKYFKENIPELNYETYYIAAESNKHGYWNHCFLIFTYRDKWYWFESAWMPYNGIRGFNTKKDCLQYIAYLVYKYMNEDKCAVYIMSYDTNESLLYNIRPNQFMKIMNSRLNRSNFIPNKSSVNKYIYKYTPSKIDPISESSTSEDNDNLILF